MPNHCHTCGRALPKPKRNLNAHPTDTHRLTDSELYAYYKRTALAEDLAFFLHFRMSPELRTRAEAIRKATAKDLVSLRGAWRTERERDDQAGIGNWHEIETASEVA